LGIGSSIYVTLSVFSNVTSVYGGTNCCFGLFILFGLLLIIIGTYILRSKKEELPKELKKGTNFAFFGIVCLCFVTILSLVMGFSLVEEGVSLAKSKPEVTIEDIIQVTRQYLPAAIALSIANAISFIIGVGCTNLWSKHFTLRLMIFIGIFLILIPMFVSIPYQFDSLDDLEEKYRDVNIRDDEKMEEYQNDLAATQNYTAAIMVLIGYFLIVIPNFITGSEFPEEKKEVKSYLDKKTYIKTQPGPYGETMIYPIPNQDYRKRTGSYTPYFRSQNFIYTSNGRFIGKYKTNPTMNKIPKKSCRFCGRQINWRAIYCPWCKKYLI